MRWTGQHHSWPANSPLLESKAMTIVNILGISGSGRQKSYSTSLLKSAGALAPAGVTMQIADISELPLYNDDLRHAAFPRSAEALCHQIHAADALLISTPEYNRSLPPSLRTQSIGDLARQ